MIHQLLTLPTGVLAALGLLVLAIGGVTYLLISPGTKKLSLSRRRPGTTPKTPLLTRATTVATGWLDRFLRRRGSQASTAAALELAGIKMRPQDFFLLIVAGVLGAIAVGVVLSGPLLAVLLAVAV